MASFNFEDIGRPVAIIKGGKGTNKKIYLATKEESEAVETPKKDYMIVDAGKFQPLPNFEKEREIGYITAPSGAGKSHYTKNYIIEYKKKYKERSVYIFSALKEDETLDSLKYIQRIRIDASLISNPLGIDDFESCLVVMDDIDVIADKHMREAVYKLLNEILQTGRHTKTTCLITNHLATNGKETRIILNEAHFITVFFGSGSAKGINYLLEKYIGLDTKEIKKIKKLSSGSRWTTIYTANPQYVITEKDIFLMSSLDDD